MLRGEKPEQMRNQRDVQDRHHPDVQRAPHLIGLQRQILEQALHLPQNRHRVFLENQPSGRQQNPFAAPLE
jgi:DNA repair exonuclease SbcCD ATPase subunit